MFNRLKKWLIFVVTLVSLLFVAASLEAKKGGGKPDKPDHTDGEAGALNCELVTDPADTVRSDQLGLYMNGVDKVACGHGGTVQPNLAGIALNTISKGAIKRAVRKIDLALGPCTGPYCGYVPDEFLIEAGNVEDMEDVWIGTGPYPWMDHIQLMPEGKHEMKSHLVPQGLADLLVVQLMSVDPLPQELSQGLWCNLEQNPEYNWSHAKTIEDMTVCIWPDNDGDSLPDGYTITTGDTDCLTPWPEVTPRDRIATICSAAGPLTCDGSDMCNLLGWVPFQMTLHATYQ